MNRPNAGTVCAAKNCKNKRYNHFNCCRKGFFRFPSDPHRARKWAINSNREDLLENIHKLNKSHRLCSDHFDSKMFTNNLCNRLKQNAIPTLFPSLEGCSKDQDLPLDHNYSLPKLVEVANVEDPPNKNCILENVLLSLDKIKNIQQYSTRQELEHLDLTEFEGTDPVDVSQQDLTCHEVLDDPLSLPDEDHADINNEDATTKSYQIPTQSVSTQTSTNLILWKEKYLENLKTLRSEKRSLEKRVEKLEELVENIMEKITLEQYQKLTYKFCSSKDIANFVNIQVTQNHKLPRGRRYTKEFKDECLAIYYTAPNIYTEYLMKQFCLPGLQTLLKDD